MCVHVIVGRGVSQGPEFKDVSIVICPCPTLVAPAVAESVVAEVSCLLMHSPFLLLSSSDSMYHIALHTYSPCDTKTPTHTK